MTTAPPRLRFLDVLTGELRKTASFRPLRRTLLLGLFTVTAFAGVGVLLTVRALEPESGIEPPPVGLNDWPMLALHYGQVVPILLGAWAVGQDTAPGPRRTAYLATPLRLTSLAAKYAVVALGAVAAAGVLAAGALTPLLLSGGAPGVAVSVDSGRLGWLAGYWVLIGLVAAGLTAATRSMLLGVIPLLAWALSLSALLRIRFPALSGAVDQVFDDAYRRSQPPTAGELALVAAQLLTALTAGAVLWTRRDAH